jgi:hypothetical protein
VIRDYPNENKFLVGRSLYHNLKQKKQNITSVEESLHLKVGQNSLSLYGEHIMYINKALNGLKINKQTIEEEMNMQDHGVI